MINDRKLTVYDGTEPTDYLLPEDGLGKTRIAAALHGPVTLKFDLSSASRKRSLLKLPDLRVRVDGMEFCPSRPLKDLGHVELMESWGLLDTVYATVGETGCIPHSVRAIPGLRYMDGPYTTRSASWILYQLLRDTGWTVGTADTQPDYYSMSTDHLTLLKNLHQLQRLWGGWLTFDSINKTVSLRDDARWRRAAGYELDSKNLKKTTDWSGVITRLTPLGKGEVDLTRRTGGFRYIDDFSYCEDIRGKTFLRRDIDDAWWLRILATQYLDGVCPPQVQYHVETLDLREVPGYKGERLRLGDMFTVRDETLEGPVEARLLAYTYDVLEPWKCSLKLGDLTFTGPDVFTCRLPGEVEA